MTACRTTGYEQETPAGISIYYQTDPKRLYRVRDAFVDWMEVPSVTAVLGCLDKPALPWWGMKIGVEGVLQLVEEGAIARADGKPVLRASVDPVYATVENVVPLLTERKITVNHVRDKAGDRGVSVHSALEAWADDHTLIPDPEFYPETERGYIRGLVAFLADLKVGKGAVQQEVMVGSVIHGYAGRYDLQLPIAECELVSHRTKAGKETRATFEKGLWLFDLKTSAGVFPSHHLQLSAYETASVECGYKPTVAQAVLRVGADGGYEVVRNYSTFADFKPVLETYYALESMKGRK